MGMYTEIFVNVNLKQDTPDDIMYVLKMIAERETVGPGHPKRWPSLFCNGSYYTPSTSCAFLTFDRISKQWSLLGKGDIKNYNREIEAFFEWIKPYVDGVNGDFIGYMRYEEEQEPTLIYL